MGLYAGRRLTGNPVLRQSLTPPGHCAGNRAYAPAKVPHIDVYYGWWSDDGPFPNLPCRRPRGTVRVFGRLRPLCTVRRDGMAGIEVRAQYSLAHRNDAEAIFTLLTTSRNLQRDLKTFKALTGSVRTCAVPDSGERFGTGAPCPKGVSWF